MLGSLRAGGHRPRLENVELAAACAQPFADVVLSGAVSTEQLASNLRARDFDGAPLADELSSMIESPDAYWATRAQLPWT